MKSKISVFYLENFWKQQTYGQMCSYPLIHSKLNLWKTTWHMLGFLGILSYRHVYCVWQPKFQIQNVDIWSSCNCVVFALCTGALPPLTFIRALLYWMNKWTHAHAHTQNSLVHQHSSPKATEWVFTATVSKASC